MKNIAPTELENFIHNVRNPLNGISLQAEFGLILLDEKASDEQIRAAFKAILVQCDSCEKVLTEILK